MSSMSTGPVFSPASIASSAVGDPEQAIGKIVANSVVNAVQEALRPPTAEERRAEQKARAEEDRREQQERDQAQQKQADALRMAEKAVEIDPAGKTLRMNEVDVKEAGAHMDSARRSADATDGTQVDDLEVAATKEMLAQRGAQGTLLQGQEFAGLTPGISHPDMARIIPLREHLMTLDLDPTEKEDLLARTPERTVRERDGRLEADVAIYWSDGRVTGLCGMPMHRDDSKSETISLDSRRNQPAPSALAA